MSQQQTGVSSKTTGQTLSASEFNSVNSTVNANATDALSKGDTTDQSVASNVDFATGKGVSFDGGDVLADYSSGYHTTTLSPAVGGSVTLASTSDVLRYRRIGNQININGRITVASVSTPSGAYVDMSLPFNIADLTEEGDFVGGAATLRRSGTYGTVPIYGFNGVSTIRVYLDATTISAGDFFIFGFAYETD